MSLNTIAKSIYEKQKKNEFGNSHYAILLRPGTYGASTNLVNIKVGYNTQVLGLGSLPTDVTVNGSIGTQDWPSSYCPVYWAHLGALNNFWRGLENVNVNSNNVTNDDWYMKACESKITFGYTYPGKPAGEQSDAGKLKGINVWAVSQASPIRRSQFTNLNFSAFGWSSGGFIANSNILQTADFGSQQQWMTRNTEASMWKNKNWNMVFMNANSPKDENNKALTDSYPFTIQQNTNLKIAEKPFIYFKENQYYVYVPKAETTTKSYSWDLSTGNSFLINNNFYIAKPTDTAKVLNEQLSNVNLKGIIFTPGVYLLENSLKVTNPNTILLGIGLPSLIPNGAHRILKVSDVDNVRIAGIIFDAGALTKDYPLVEIGDKVTTTSHSGAPTVLSDFFCRVGGRSGYSGQAKTCLLINSNNVIGDNLWLWRADHGEAGTVGWTINTSDNGLIVNGNNVTIYGLAVEHFQKYQTVWNGDSGNIFFYQSEMPYDVPNADSWKNGGNIGYASYYIGPKVKNHNAYGLGIYTFFRDTPIMATNAIQVDSSSPGIQLHHILNVWLNGYCGSTLSSATIKSTDYPVTCNPNQQSGMSNLVNTTQGFGIDNNGPTATRASIKANPVKIMGDFGTLNLILPINVNGPNWDATPTINGTGKSYLENWPPPSQ